MRILVPILVIALVIATLAFLVIQFTKNHGYM